MRDAKVNPSLAPRSLANRRAAHRADPHSQAAENARTALADPDFELIVGDPAASFRWRRHDYPSALARWNYHPEYEIHLIAESAGKMFVGDHIGAFEPGNLILAGPNLPHHWVSDLGPGERIEGRDVVLQFTGSFIDAARRAFPEFDKLLPLLEQSRRGVEFLGDEAEVCGGLLMAIGEATGLARIALFISLIERMAAAKRKRLLASETYRPELIVGGDAKIGAVIEYMFANVHDVRLSAAAGVAGMNEFDVLAPLQAHDRRQFRRLRAQDPDRQGLHAAGGRRPRHHRNWFRVRLPEHLELQPDVPARERHDAARLPSGGADAERRPRLKGRVCATAWRICAHGNIHCQD